MAIEFNTAPYYDDFDKTKKFYRILFKPGRSVQARELTQMQTILQNQIEQFGKNIFKDGSLVVGARTFISGGQYLKIASTDVDLATFDGATIVGATSSATGIVRKYEVERTIDGTTYPDTLYIAPTSGLFTAGETITIENTSVTATLDATSPLGPATFFSIDESIFFVKGHFVYCPKQTVVVSNTFVAQPSARIGLKITDGIYTSDDDSTLLDPAVGASNYFAPGADRYYIDLELASIIYDPDVEDSDTVTINEFIEIANLRQGKLSSLLRDPQYNIIEDTLARRTFDESGDYTVTPFIVKVRDHLFGNVDRLTLEISPGKAYVRGYEFETIAPTYINMDRARDYQSVEDFPFSADYGRYITVNGVGGNYNTHNSQIVHLHKVKYGNILFTSNADYFSNVIGTARVRYFEQESAATSTYDLYLFDIKMTGSNVFGNTASIVGTVNSSTVTTASNVTAFSNVYGNAVLTYGTDDSLLFKLPQNRIKTFSNANFTAQRLFAGTTFSPSGSNCVATITLTGSEYFVGTGVLSDDAINARFYAAVTATSNTTTFPLNKVLALYGNDGNVTITSPQTAEIRVTGADSFSANVVALTTTIGSASKTKTLANSTVTVGTSANLYSIDLGVSDVYKITSILDYTGNTYLGIYDLDTGQRDDFYDYGRAVLKTGATPPTLNANTNPNVTIAFQYFSHTGTGYFDVDSYGSAGITYSNIPTYTNNKGEVISLSDVIDFRPVRPAASNTFASVKLIQPGSTFYGDYEYYLPRKDKLVLTRDRRFKLVKGVSSNGPVIPEDLPDGMTLYSFSLPAYTGSYKDVQTTYYEHKRYTMRDIGKIEKRVNRVEYYTALSLLEKIAADELIISNLTGIDRFKNGILVDPFAGHSVGDVRNGDYKCAIDPVNRTLRPMCASESFGYWLDETNSTNFRKAGDIVTPNYSNANYINQLKATGVVSLTPFEVFDWIGRMELTPATDVWADTITAPDVTVNLNGENDAFTQITLDNTGLTPYGTVWNNWQTVFRGVTDVDVSTSATTTVNNEVAIDAAGNLTVTPTAQTATSTTLTTTAASGDVRTGLQFASASKTINTSLGTKIVDSSIVPYIRSREIKFHATGLKPNTRLYATFDGVDVTQYCRAAVEITFTTNNIPTSNVVIVTHGDSGWSGEVITTKQGRKKVKVKPDTRYRLPVVGNTIAFANTATTAEVSNVLVRQELVTDETGSISGIFTIPNDENVRFNIGERAFVLADSLNRSFVTTSAETKYLAYGISNTKEETILATRINLTSITPALQTRTSGVVTTSVNDVDQGVSTTGGSNTVALPPPTNTQTLFCGSNVRANGGRGIHTFAVRLGPGVGRGNIICNSGVVPDRFTLNYGGSSRDTGFMTSSATKTATIDNYNNTLKNLSYPEVTLYGANNVKLPFEKLTAENETAYVRVDAPIEGTGWNIQVECPSGNLTLETGTARLSRYNVGQCVWNFVTPNDRRLDGIIRTSAALSGYHFFDITNTADTTGLNWTTGTGNKSITINALNVTLPSGATGTTSTIVTSGTVPSIASGTSEFINPSNATQVALTMGTLPITLGPGESRRFGVLVTKTAAGAINGTITVTPTIVGPTGNTVPCNTADFAVTTTPGGDEFSVQVDPVAQTFFVQEVTHPSGVFISSIDAFFYEKDNNIPVSCEIRPVVNGYPSSFEIVPFSSVTVDADDVVVSALPDLTKYTRFSFPAPVYLKPGQYSFVLRTSSTNYRAFTATLGEFSLINADERVDKPAYIGVFFKSQNASAWTAEQNEDLMFRINRCQFDTTAPASLLLKTNAPSNNVEFDVFYTSGEVIDLADTDIEYKYKTTPESTGVVSSTYTNYNIGYNYPMAERMLIKKNDSNSLQFNVNLSTANPVVAPVVDLNRLESVLVRNIINNDATGEDGYSGGNAAARYITRKVTLNPGFEATDLRVYFNAYCPANTSVKVYYKVNAPGTTQFDSQNQYVEMTDVTINGNQRAAFGEYTVGTADNKCLADGARFNTFVIKIVMLSDNTVYVPIIRDLRVIALDE